MTKHRGLRRWWLLVGVAAVAVLAVIGYRCLPMAPLPAHTGDGDFTDISWRAKAFGLVSIWDVRGYTVSMPRFDLGKDHTATYRVSRLPDIGLPCQLSLTFDDPKGRWFIPDERVISKLRGSLMLEVRDRHREVLLHTEGPLSDYTWGHWRNAAHVYWEDAVTFRARPEEEYTIRMVYQGNPALANYQGYCCLECGGKL